jgi:hypothetical protein
MAAEQIGNHRPLLQVRAFENEFPKNRCCGGERMRSCIAAAQNKEKQKYEYKRNDRKHERKIRSRVGAGQRPDSTGANVPGE